ncbi:hypothetical protein C3K47_19240 [Solitalea longa]|uniref:Uncharacterized protein n=1 Tax=Solitalea longa TaxID=2079460 RepID=A0A2S4ZW94_9SPHI|nr:hypothetical protein [Solitalea longa]POY34638.1 hypothetical protein C3K47_19240 [Solitalea longa]
MHETLTAIQAIARLRKFGQLDHCIVNELLDLRELTESGDKVVLRLIFSNCQFKEIDSTSIEFTKPLVLQNCVVDKFDIYATCFIGGFTIENNIFNEYIQFMHADHGADGQLRLAGNVFNEFVDFEDAGFKSRIEIVNNSFKKGTNLLADVQLAAQFTGDSTISNNEGKLKIRTHFGTIL